VIQVRANTLGGLGPISKKERPPRTLPLMIVRMHRGGTGEKFKKRKREKSQRLQISAILLGGEKAGQPDSKKKEAFASPSVGSWRRRSEERGGKGGDKRKRRWPLPLCGEARKQGGKGIFLQYLPYTRCRRGGGGRNGESAARGSGAAAASG